VGGFNGFPLARLTIFGGHLVAAARWAAEEITGLPNFPN